VVALNRAVALAEVQGPRAGLEALRPVLDGGALDGYHLVPAIVGDLHLRLGEMAEAARHLQRAHALTGSRAERLLLEEKLRACGVSPASSPERGTLQA
jgi:predicted RNA polymerase sigma factor